MGSLGKDELKEELDRIPKMSPYERLAYIRNLVKFYRQIGEFSEEAMHGLCDRLMLVTKGYDRL